jgi:hypothetical protein
MLHSTLTITNPDHDRELLADYRALYAGGKTFRARIERFLLPNDMEPTSIYEKRKQEASYRSYVGPIVDYFAAFLLASGFEPIAQDDAGNNVDTDPAYKEFVEDCDGNGTDLDAFLRERATDALVARSAWWRLEKADDGGAPAADLLEAEKRGLNRVTIHDVEPCEVLDWSFDGNDKLEWVTTYTCTRAKRDPHAPQTKTRHEWRIYGPQTVEVYASEISPNERLPDEIPLIEAKYHGFSTVPFVRLDVGERFWVVNRLRDTQVEIFRLNAGVGWSIRRTCYAMPVFNIEGTQATDGSVEYKPPTMGAGYYLVIGPNDKAGYLSPPTEALDLAREQIKGEKDEAYRVVHQMALGVENNAAAVGRSGESKLADAEAIRVILTSLGSIMRNAVEKTFELVSDARKDPHNWNVDGLDVYDDIDAAPLLEAINSATPLDIPSETFQIEIKTRAALALIASADSKTKDAVREEIKQGITQQLADKKALADATRKAQIAGANASVAGAKDETPPKPSEESNTLLASNGV